MLTLAIAALILWLIVLMLPWQPWRCREWLEADLDEARPIADIAVLIPARDEAAVIGSTLQALADIDADMPIVLVDDESTDDTVAIARNSSLNNLTIVTGSTPPVGWSGKLWALQQGMQQVHARHVLLLDADIQLAPGLLTGLRHKLDDGYALVSLYAEPDFTTRAARWLMPAFAYFFKMLYPFESANRGDSRVAAAAGGIVLVNVEALHDIGGFAAWHDAIIDDCTMARHVKQAGHRTWIGLTRSAFSQRRAGLRDIVHMVARTAFVQLRHSWLILLGVTLVMLLLFWPPVIAAIYGSGMTRLIGIAGWWAMIMTCLPTLIYYQRQPFAAIAMPVTATCFLAMTWYAAGRTLRGTRSVWKGRRYPD